MAVHVIHFVSGSQSERRLSGSVRAHARKQFPDCHAASDCHHRKREITKQCSGDRRTTAALSRPSIFGIGAGFTAAPTRAGQRLELRAVTAASISPEPPPPPGTRTEAARSTEHNTNAETCDEPPARPKAATVTGNADHVAPALPKRPSSPARPSRGNDPDCSPLRRPGRGR